MCPVDVSSLLGNFKAKFDVNLITDFNATFASLSGYKLTFNDLICELSNFHAMFHSNLYANCHVNLCSNCIVSSIHIVMKFQILL